MWKFYFIEVLSSFMVFSILMLSISIFALIFFGIMYFSESTSFLGDKDLANRALKIVKKASVVFIIFATTTCLIPSKEFMYINLGIHETVKFIEGNEETKEIGAKIIKIVNNKLDEMVDSSENK